MLNKSFGSGILVHKYFKRVMALGPIGYWPLWDQSGTTAQDISGNGFDGANSAVALGAPGIGDGRTASSYDGLTSVTVVASAGLSAAFDGSLLSIMVFLRVSGAGVWTDGDTRHSVLFQADGANFVSVNKNTNNNQAQAWYNAGGVFKAIPFNTSTVSYINFILTASDNTNDDELKLYVNGAQTGATVTGLGTWAGNPTTATIGRGGIASWFDGDEAHVALWDRVLTPAEALSIGVL